MKLANNNLSNSNLSNTHNKEYIPYTILIGALAILVVLIYNNAFKKGYFTCNKYILNTYLYILLVIIIVCLQVLIMDNQDIKVEQIYGQFQGWLGIIVFFILVLGLLIITLAINPRNVFLKHVSWFLFAMASGLLVYPAYMISKKNNTLVRVLYSLIGILVFFSSVAFVRPDWISLTWGPILLFLLVGVIILHLVFLFTKSKKYEEDSVYPKWLSYGVIVLFIFFVLYDTKLIQVNAKNCQEKTVDYINESMGIFIDALNLFQNLVMVNT